MRAFYVAALVCLICLTNLVYALEIVDAKVVDNKNVGGIVVVEIDVIANNQIAGSVINHSADEISDVVVVVRHHWVWPYSGKQDTDSASQVEYIELPDNLQPGESKALVSSVTPPANLPDDASYFAEAKISGYTRLSYKQQ